MKRIRPVHLAIVLACTYFVVLWLTAPAVGFTRDEGYYFKAAEEYSRFFGVLFSSRFFDAFSDAEILKHFDYNHEHPPLVKLIQGLTYHVFSNWTGLTSPSMGFRVTGFFFGGLSVFATFLLGRHLISARVGLLAALLVTTLPRYFFHAHLACFDVAITALWTLALFTFSRALTGDSKGRRGRILWAALVFGLALSAKLNALFLPFVFVALWLVAPPEPLDLKIVDGPSGGRDVQLPRIPWVLIACAIIGPLVFWLSWPYLWHDTFKRIGGYIGFHMHHEHYPISFYGDLLVKPPFPWKFPITMSIYTLPAPVLFLAGLGLLASFLRSFRRSHAEVLLTIATLLPVLLIAMPTTPIFGGVKHWFNAMPAICILAARSVFWAVDALEEYAPQKLSWLVAAASIGLVALPGALGCVRSHPNGIGYYNELAGGFRGGAQLGMQRGYWGGMAAPLYEGVSGRVFFNRTNYDSYRMYRREGRFPKATSYANDAKGATVGVHFEQAEHAEQEGTIWSALGTRPTAGVYQDNVTLIQLYERGKSSKAP